MAKLLGRIAMTALMTLLWLAPVGCEAPAYSYEKEKKDWLAVAHKAMWLDEPDRAIEYLAKILVIDPCHKEARMLMEQALRQAKTEKEPEGQHLPAQFRSPKELARKFVDALFKSPESAYSLYEDTYRASTSEGQFRASLGAMLPPPDTITSVKLVAFEEGFQESDGRSSCSSAYEVLSSERLQPKSKVEVDMVKTGDTYRVRRFSVSAIPQ